MNTLPQRLRTMADHTGLDAVAELLLEAAAENEALRAAVNCLTSFQPEPPAVTIQKLHAENEALRILNDALAEQPAEQEPVRTEFNRVINHAIEQGFEASTFLRCWREGDWSSCKEFGFDPNTEAYTAPQPAKQPLTDDEIWKNDAIMAANSGYGATFETLREIVRAIEAAHGITGETE